MTFSVYQTAGMKVGFTWTICIRKVMVFLGLGFAAVDTHLQLTAPPVMMSVDYGSLRRSWILGCSLMTAEIAAAQQHAHELRNPLNRHDSRSLTLLRLQRSRRWSLKLFPRSTDQARTKPVSFTSSIAPSLRSRPTNARPTGRNEEIQQARYKLFPQSTSIAD